MKSDAHESKIDVRIIVRDLNIAQLVSQAVNNIQLENDYNIIVSSIIPTVDVSIVKKVAVGADILLIGGYGRDETYNILFNELKTDFNHVGLFDYNNIIDEDESFDSGLASKEIHNSIIKSTLSYSLNLINIHTLENKLMKVTKNYNSLLDDYNKVLKEQEVLTSENDDLRHDLDEIRSDFSQFKSRYENISSREILEVFNIHELWKATFGEDLADLEKIVLASDKFKPDNIIVGQGYIAAESRKAAAEWLNIVRTALIFVEADGDNLKKDLSQDKESKPPEVREDYEIPSDFENFWE